MNVKKLIMINALALAVGGCTSMQSSTYESIANADETRIKATGAAAVEAARSTTVTACHTCAGQQAPSQVRPQQRQRANLNPGKYQQAAQRVHDRALNTASVQVSVEIDKVIRDFLSFGSN